MRQALLLSVGFVLACAAAPASEAVSDAGTVSPDASVGTAGDGGAGAGGDAGAEPVDAGGGDGGTRPSAVLARPYDLHVPSSYDGARAMPLVILLHGYSGSASWQEWYLKLQPVADEKGFLYATPEGLIDRLRNRYWNATDACCDFDQTGVDDVAYIGAIIDDVALRYRLDEKRVFLVGHSNGGFLSHRAACDLSERIAGIVSLAGAQWLDASRCQPTSPVAVLQVHGTADTTIAYLGGHPMGNALIPRHPGAQETVSTWGRLNGCSPDRVQAGTLDLDYTLFGEETLVTRHEGCRGGAAELWTILGGQHIPGLRTGAGGFGEKLWDFLEAHPKP
jgi:polyhydroxybutyrate depolymerase